MYGTDDTGDLIMANKEAAKSWDRDDRRKGKETIGGLWAEGYYSVNHSAWIPEKRAIVSKPERDMLLKVETGRDWMNYPTNTAQKQKTKTMTFNDIPTPCLHTPIDPKHEALKQAYLKLEDMHAVAMKALLMIENLAVLDETIERVAADALNEIQKINGMDV